MFVITGITGHTGGGVAKALLAQGQKVRGIVRSQKKADEWRSHGAEVVLAELSDTKAITAALEGADGAYLMTPPYMDADDMFAASARDVKSLAQAVSDSAVPKVVYLSSLGAQRSTGTGAILKLHDLEQALGRLPVASAAIRAAWFIENFAPLLPAASANGVLPSFLAPLDRKVPMVATADISTAAADLLLESWNGQRVVELEGPARWSPVDVAKAMGKVLGKPVTAQLLPREQWRPAYQSWGLNPIATAAMEEMVDSFNRGLIDFEPTGTEHKTGTTGLEEVFRSLVQS